jgi:trk system potassium uptake protein TrkA
MAQRQVLIVGLGQFGMSLARALTNRGVSVLGVDEKRELVDEAATFIHEAACFDAAKEDALRHAAPAERDVCVCAIGEEAREAAIMVTALLKQMGAKQIVARCASEVTGRILKLVGADETVNPERSFGERMANRLFFEQIVDEVALGEDLVISEVIPPTPFVGRTLNELGVLRRYDVNVVAIRQARGRSSSSIKPDLDRPLEAEDILVMVARQGAIGRLLDHYKQR